jgi:hypothetical protein
MKRLHPCIAFLLFSTYANAQLPGEFAAVSCTPSKEIAAGFTIEKTGHNSWGLFANVNGKHSMTVQSMGEISNVIGSPKGDFIAFFLSFPIAPKMSGWRLQRLSDGHAEQVDNSQLPPESACLSPDGKKLVYVNQSIAVVQIDLTPVYVRLTFHDHPKPPASEA